MNEIKLQSRYDVPHEIRELRAFALAAIPVYLDRYIKSVFYDSQACFAWFEWRYVEPVYGDPIFNATYQIALETIQQFQLGDCVYGNGCYDPDEWIAENEPASRVLH